MYVVWGVCWVWSAVGPGKASGTECEMWYFPDALLSLPKPKAASCPLHVAHGSSVLDHTACAPAAIVISASYLLTLSYTRVAATKRSRRRMSPVIC